MPFEKHLIGFSETNSFSRLIVDYLNEDKKLKPFYSYPLSEEGFLQAINKRKAYQTNRVTLAETLKFQYEGLKDSRHVELALSQINRLSGENTFTVTTGHQLNIFTGPLYFFYKIFSAINLSEELKKNFPAYDFVPLYWMANEDHDFEEISYVHLYDKKIRWQQEQNGAAGDIPTSTMQPVLDEIKIALGESENAQKIYHLFETAYTKHRTLTDAMRFLVHELFGSYGLIILDASDKQLKSLAKKVFKGELLNQFSFESVIETTAELEKHYKSQVFPRELNLFYMPENVRERIELRENRYYIRNQDLSFTREEILDELENFPERFSPNVVLRPLYQEYLLPDLAYVGGGAEIAYWMQYKAMFESQNVFFPVLVLRDSVLIIEKNLAKKVSSSGLGYADLFLPYDDLVKLVIAKGEDGKIKLQDEAVSIEIIFDKVGSKISAVDPTLLGAANAEKQKTLNALKGLEEKSIRALKRKNETLFNQLKQVKESLFPENSLQERYYNFSMFYVKYGDDFFNVLKNSLNPLQKKFIVLEETG